MTIYADIETLDFFQDAHIKALPRDQQLAAMRFGCAVTAQIDDSAPNDHNPTWREWATDQVADLYTYLVTCRQPIVGWNLIGFDWPVIKHNAHSAGWTDVHIGYEIVDMRDLFALIRTDTGRWYSLETVAVANLGRGKLADGQQAAAWLRSGEPELLRKAMDYCRHDVQLTIELHSLLLRGDSLLLPKRADCRELNDLRWRPGTVEHVVGADGVLGVR